MKKTLFTMMAVMVFTLSTKANDMSDELCSDQKFLSYVNEVLTLSQDLKSFNEEELEAFRCSAQYEARIDALVEKSQYLESTYLLFSKSAEKQTQIKAAVKKLWAEKKLRAAVDPNECLPTYMVMISACSLLSQDKQAVCYELAAQYLMGCALSQV